MQRGGLGSKLADCAPAYLPILVVFLLVPFAIYLSNQGSFNNDISVVLPYLYAAALSLLVLTFALLLMKERPRTVAVVSFFYIGAYLALSDMAFPVQLSELMGGRETPLEPMAFTIGEFVLAAALVVCAAKLPWKHVKKFATAFVVILLVTEAFTVARGLSKADVPKAAKSPPSIAPKTEKGNVYHITMDAYSSNVFLNSVEEMGYRDKFEGFTFFRNNRSNYIYTKSSVPSFMTGTFYDGKGLKKWTESHKTAGIATDLSKAGYAVSVYALDYWWVNKDASYVKTNYDVLAEKKSHSAAFLFADLWLVRLAPNYLQDESFYKGKGLFTRLFVNEKGLSAVDGRPFLSAQLMRRMMDEERLRPDRGQYVYAHFYLPHNPFVMDRDCEFVEGKGTYQEQALCGTRLMAEFLDRLKELGRYEGSTVIFQSDHGDWNIAPDEHLSLDKETGKKLDAMRMEGLRGENIINYTHSLLLIKPPAEPERPLAVSERQTQLMDIPATLYGLVGVSAKPQEGMSVFSADFPEKREIHVYAGYLKRDKNKKILVMGHDFFDADFYHLSFTNGRGWKIYDNIPVSWE